MSTKPMVSHAALLASECRIRVVKRWGKTAWQLLSEEQQKGAVALELLRVVMNQDTDHDPKSALLHCQAVISASGVFND